MLSVSCFILSIILRALTFSTPLFDEPKCSSNSSRVKLEVKKVVKPSSIRYWSIVPSTSSLDQGVVVSAPISSNSNISTFFIFFR